MTVEIKGQVKAIHPIETRGDYSFRKVWLVTDTDTTYPQTIELQAGGKKLNEILPDGKIKAGDSVTCHVNINGREWAKDGKTSVFNTLSIWKIEKDGQYQQPQTDIHQQGTAAAQNYAMPQTTNGLPPAPDGWEYTQDGRLIQILPF